jgi:hypothetical protein
VVSHSGTDVSEIAGFACDTSPRLSRLTGPGPSLIVYGRSLLRGPEPATWLKLAKLFEFLPGLGITPKFLKRVAPAVVCEREFWVEFDRLLILGYGFVVSPFPVIAALLVPVNHATSMSYPYRCRLPGYSFRSTV